MLLTDEKCVEDDTLLCIGAQCLVILKNAGCVLFLVINFGSSWFVEKGDLVYFVEEKMEPYEDQIKIIPFESEEEELLFLRVPNLNSTTNPINFRGTKFQKYDDLLGTDETTKEDIINKIQSSSLLDVQLNIDYQKRTDKLGERSDFGFGNFVNFSSAENRIRNFKKKVQLIEGYTKYIGDLVNVSSSLETRNNLSKN